MDSNRKKKNCSIIGIMWVFQNKLDENGKVNRNKVWLSSQGYSQQEYIGYNETFATVDGL